VEKRRIGGDVVNPCEQPRQKIRQIAQEIVRRAVDPLTAANSIYGIAWESGAWEDNSACEGLAEAGAEFLQLADALEESQEQPDVKLAWQNLIREAADAYLAGRAWPDWKRVPGSLYPVVDDRALE
jgi:hypothetical protein